MSAKGFKVNKVVDYTPDGDPVIREVFINPANIAEVYEAPRGTYIRFIGEKRFHVTDYFEEVIGKLGW